MTDNEFWEIISTTLQAAIDALVPLNSEYGNITLVDGFQPQQEGAPTYPLVVFHGISGKRYGWQGRKDKFNQVDDDFDHSESRIIERTIQVGAMVQLDPEDLTKPTAFDVVEEISSLLQSEQFRMSLLSQGIGIIRITDVRTPVFSDESDDFVEDPNFDFTVNFTKTSDTKISKVSQQSGTVYPVP